MQFLYPAFLWALTALAIPIILHLFYFRRYKKVYFSNLRFLREVKEETSARNRLRNLLILLSRLMAMACVVLAFAQPVIPLSESLKAGIRKVSLFVDNSFSMQSFGTDLSLFDRARQKAQEVIMGYGPEDHFQILGHDLSPSQHQWISRDEALIRLEEIEYTPAVKPLSVIQGRQKQSFGRVDGMPVAWMISDFQKTIFDLDLSDTTATLNLLPLRGVQEKNVAIDSVWFESPMQSLNQTVALYFTVHNYTAEEADNIRVTINLDGQERPEGTLDIPGLQLLTDTAQITVLKTGWHQLAIRISDFPVTFDDSYFITFYVRENMNVLSINERLENKKISAVFADHDDFILENNPSNSIAYADFNTYQLIILNELITIPSGLIASLRKYVDDGGKVLFIPRANGPVPVYNALLKSFGAAEFGAWSTQERPVGKINTEAFIYQDVFSRTRPNMRLPKVKGSYPYTGTGTRGESLLGFRDGGDLATLFRPGQGVFCVLTSPLDETYNDFILQPEVFVPLLYNLTIYSSDSKKLSYTIGDDHLIPMERAVIDLDKEVQISGASEFIPGLSPFGNKVLLDVQGQVAESGFYTVSQLSDIKSVLAFNYNRKESDLALASLDELPEDGSIRVWEGENETDFTQLIESNRQGKPIWRWCIILGLIFIGIEIALIRLWRS